MSLIKILKFILFIIFLFLIISCKQKDTTLRIAFTSMPETFDIIMRNEFFTNAVNNNIFETVLRFEGLEANPIISDYWYSPNDSLFILKIKENIRFSDGTLLTIHDVKESILRAYFHPNSFFRDFVIIDSLKVESDYLLNIYHPKSDFIVSFLNYVAIYKADHLKKFDDNYLKNNPVSTGEYYLFSATSEKIILKKNKFHRNFTKNKKSPDIVEIIYEPSKDKQFQLYLDNEIDFIFNLPIKHYYNAKNNQKMRIIEQESNTVLYLMLDATSDKSPDIDLEVNPLKNKIVRKAIAHSIDTRSFIKNNLYGRANILSTPLLKHFKGYQVSIDYYTYDVELAKEYMKQAGFLNGFKLRIKSIQGKFTGDEDLAIYIKDSLKKINIDVEIDFYPSESFYKFLAEIPVSAFLTGYTSTAGHIGNSIRNLFYYTEKSKGNLNRLNNVIPEINELSDNLLHMTDFDSQVSETHRLMSEIIFEEAIVIPFYQPYDLFLLRKNFLWHPSQYFFLSEFKVK